MRLNSDLILYTFFYLEVNDLLLVQLVCCDWYTLARDNLVWSNKLKQNSSIEITKQYNFYEIYAKQPWLRKDKLIFKRDNLFYVGEPIRCFKINAGFSHHPRATPRLIQSRKSISKEDIISSFAESKSHTFFFSKNDAYHFCSKLITPANHIRPILMFKLNQAYSKIHVKVEIKTNLYYVNINKGHIIPIMAYLNETGKERSIDISAAEMNNNMRNCHLL